MNRYSAADAVVETDEEAYKLLPPYALVHTEYKLRRSAGEGPQQALHSTLALWRELRAMDRPAAVAANARPKSV